MELKNHLVSEKSPYLLQHKDNPVFWFAWGEPAFEAARELDRPIFLSIGYSTCHWCHVMEKESFEDESVAALLNESMIAIKVDREERPDVDHLYMTVCRMMGANCGWPLNVILTPDKKPFFATTYVPKETRHGRLGMLDLVPRIASVWKDRREEVISSASAITDSISAFESPTSENSASEPPDFDAEILDRAFQEFSDRFDPVHGGFGPAPKFPSAHNLLFLLRYWKRSGNEYSLRMVEKTLEKMRAGGVYDQVGFGFHRYSTDSSWTVPHFEKMLYDQAMLSLVYTEAYQATGNPLFSQTVREILSYVARDMRDPAGGFYSAEDADSEGEEGLFYLWTRDEIRSVLGSESIGVERAFQVSEEGNYVDEVTGSRSGRNILFGAESASSADPDRDWEPARKKMFDSREERIHPGKDDKVLTDWNGLMMAAFARAASVFGDAEFLDRAVKAADFLLEEMLEDDGQLLHRWLRGDAGIEATAADYVFLIWGLLELYEAGFDTRYLKKALDLTEILYRQFEDSEAGGLFMTSDQGEVLIARQKEVYDGAIPSSNSVAVLNLLRLARITGNTEFESRAASITRYAGAQIAVSPSAFSAFLIGLDMGLGPSFEVVVAGREDAEDTKTLFEALRTVYVPNKVVLFRDDMEDRPGITELAPYTLGQRSLGGCATAYVCRNFVCNLPTTDPVEMVDYLSHPERIGRKE